MEPVDVFPLRDFIVSPEAPMKKLLFLVLVAFAALSSGCWSGDSYSDPYYYDGTGYYSDGTYYYY
jgi:hypothetical protein